MDYISQFTTDIQHIKGIQNCIADALSRIEIATIQSTVLDLPAPAEAQTKDYKLMDGFNRPPFKIENVLLSTSDGVMICNTSTGIPRPIVPENFRRIVFDTLHNLSHPGIAASLKLEAQRYVWPSVNKDVRNWARQCQSCQRSKIQRHVNFPIGTFTTPDTRFDHVHIDLVGPLTPSNGFNYLLTCIDRFTRWPEAIPISDSTEENVARNFVERWIDLYGCPSTLTIDRGRQFESSLFDVLTRTLGTERIRTNAYHPSANGLVERFHRQLKSSLKAQANYAWNETLPLVLLGIRNSLKSDLNCTASQIVFGTTLRLPGEFFTPRFSQPLGDLNYAERLSTYMHSLVPALTRTQNKPFYIPKDLETCSHVFLRVDSVRKPLQQPYEGPFQVISRQAKTFKIPMKNRIDTVNIDRLKVAYMNDEDNSNQIPPNIDTNGASRSG